MGCTQTKAPVSPSVQTDDRDKEKSTLSEGATALKGRLCNGLRRRIDHLKLHELPFAKIALRFEMIRDGKKISL